MSRKLPPLSILQTFSVVAASGSFTAASRELHLSQSAVSRQIQQLENYMGEKLFHRQARKLILTQQGEALLPSIEKSITSLKDSLENALEKNYNITVRMAPTIARRWFVPKLPDLLRQCPELNVNVDTAWFLEPQFALGEVDVVISYGRGHWPGMKAIALLKEQITPVCAPHFPLLQHVSSPIDLLEQSVRLHSNNAHSDWSLWLQDQQLNHLSSYKDQVFDTQDYALTAAESGYGIAIGDLALIQPELATEQLICPFKHTIYTGCGYYATYPNSSAQLPKIKLFIDWLVQMSPLAQNLSSHHL